MTTWNFSWGMQFAIAVVGYLLHMGLASTMLRESTSRVA